MDDAAVADKGAPANVSDAAVSHAAVSHAAVSARSAVSARPAAR